MCIFVDATEGHMQRRGPATAGSSIFWIIPLCHHASLLAHLGAALCQVVPAHGAGGA